MWKIRSWLSSDVIMRKYLIIIDYYKIHDILI